jgi:hypothetical protein
MEGIMKNWILVAGCLLLVVFIGCEDLFNLNKIDISGTIIDVNDVGISGVKITTDPATKEVYTDSSGNFIIDKVDKPEDRVYTVIAEVSGYQKAYEYYVENESLTVRMRRYLFPQADINITYWNHVDSIAVIVNGTVENTDTQNYHYVEIFVNTYDENNNLLDVNWGSPNTTTSNILAPQEEAEWSVTCDKYLASISTVSCYAVYDIKD